jgi:hypothetical protein
MLFASEAKKIEGFIVGDMGAIQEHENDGVYDQDKDDPPDFV